MEKRAVILVIDGLGAGAMPDAHKYGDPPQCNTLANVAGQVGGLRIPNLERLGLGNILPVTGVKTVDRPMASFGLMKEASKGKDTTTGHWELAGLPLNRPFRTYPEGFPQVLIDKFIEKTGCKGVLGNYPASGTAIIRELGDEHVKTGFPIVYTSADSVFQIACHVGIVPLETLYNWCRTARALIDENSGDHNICRVIARPFDGEKGDYKRISAARKDFSVPPPGPTLLNLVEKKGGTVLGIGKIEDIFVKSGVTKAVHTGSNREGLQLTLESLQRGGDNLVFVNLVDTDMLFGHRNDVEGFAGALAEIDGYLGEIIPLITDNDLLVITADHGCDPTAPGTDHTREKVPVLVYSPSLEAKNLGEPDSFSFVADTVVRWLGL